MTGVGNSLNLGQQLSNLYYLADNSFINLYGTTLYPNFGAIGLSLTYSGTTLTIAGSDGTSLATFNATTSTQNQSTFGQQVTSVISNNYTTTFGAASNTSGALFGVTSGVAWGNPLPFFVYIVEGTSSGILTFMFSRQPNVTTSPIAASISKAGSIVNVSQADFFAMDSSITVANFASKPCICVGSFRATMSAANNWTVTALDAGDGMWQFQEGRAFTFPTGQLGAATGTHLLNNGGTAPVFTSEGAVYYVDRSGYCRYTFSTGDCTSSGVGAVNLQLATPYVAGTGTVPIACGEYAKASVSNNPFVATLPSGTSFYNNMIYGGAVILNTGVTSTFIGDQFYIDHIFKIQ